VIVGLIAEVALAWLHLPPDSACSVWGTVLADSLVAIGVSGEVQFSRMAFRRDKELKRRSDEKVAEAKARAAEANQKAQESILELARLREQGALTTDAVLETAKATKANALAAQFLLALSQQLAQLMVPGMKMPGFLSVEQHIQIVSKVKLFAGKQFDVDIDITSSSVERTGLLGTLIAALKEAGWVQVGRHEPSSIDFTSVRGVTINVDASKDSELLGAAGTLASALNAEGITAAVNPKIETDIINANVIHILVGPRP